MKKYGYFSRVDSTRELLDSIIAVNEEDAICFFSTKKGLNKNSFLDIFNVLLISID
jgi:hypothetical protein